MKEDGKVKRQDNWGKKRLEGEGGSSAMFFCRERGVIQHVPACAWLAGWLGRYLGCLVQYYVNEK